MKKIFLQTAIVSLFFFNFHNAHAQLSGGVRLPSGGLGIQGSVGLGFADFKVQSPDGDLKFDRGTFASVAIERAFFSHFYLTLTLSHMSTNGMANYDYTNLSSSTTYTENDVNFSAKMNDLGIGFKLKLFDSYWFRPYIEGGGLGGYHEINYSPTSLATGYKKKDNIMGSGYYAEAGLEASFSERFGVKLAGRSSQYDTKGLETLGNRGLRFTTETYYFSALMGF